jgi:single-strand DNA-binding protein
MPSLNQVNLIGNITADIELRHTKSGQEVSTCSIALNEKFKDASGQVQERTEFVNLVFWRKQSELLNRFCKKGSGIFVTGKLQTQSWTDNNNQKRYKTEIVVSNFQLLSKGKDHQNNTQQSTNNQHSVGYNSEVPQYDQDTPF